MTMADGKCEVCNVNEPIGVASTAVPLSVAYCLECARRNAQPLLVFCMWEDDGIKPDEHRCPEIETFEDGKYVSYRDWYNRRHECPSPSSS